MAYSNPEGYERFMGRWSARLAPLFVRFAGVKDGQRILHTDHPKPLCGRAGPKELAEIWVAAGLADVRTTSLELSMEFSSFDDFWVPFLGGPTRSSAFAAAIDQKTGGALAKRLRGIIPKMQPDGSFVLPARARAVAGNVGG